jgi:hypothetical protein
MALVGSASLRELNRDVEWLGPAVRNKMQIAEAELLPRSQ